MITPKLFFSISAVALSATILSSCDSKKTGFETNGSNQVAESSDLGWLPKGASLEALPVCAAAIKPQRIPGDPANVIEIIVEDGKCKVIGTITTTEHGPIDSLATMPKKGDLASVTMRKLILDGLTERVSQAIGIVHDLKIRPVVFISIPADSPALLASHVVGTCKIIDLIDLRFVTAAHEGDELPYRYYQYQSSSGLDLGMGPEMEVAALTLGGGQSSFVYGKNGGGKFDLSSPETTNPELNSHLKSFLDFCRLTKTTPRIGILFGNTKEPDQGKTNFQFTMDLLALFHQAGVEECSLAPSGIHFFKEYEVEEPKLNINRITPPPSKPRIKR